MRIEDGCVIKKEKKMKKRSRKKLCLCPKSEKNNVVILSEQCNLIFGFERKVDASM